MEPVSGSHARSFWQGTCTWCHYSRASEDLTAALRLLSEHKIHPDSRELAQAFDRAAEEAMRLDQLASALSPLLGTREATPENVAEVVARAVDDRDTLESIAQVASDCGDCPCCGMSSSPEGFVHDVEYGDDGEVCPIAKVAADAARSEPEERE